MYKITIATAGVEVCVIEADDKETALQDLAEELASLDDTVYTVSIGPASEAPAPDA